MADKTRGVKLWPFTLALGLEFDSSQPRWWEPWAHIGRDGCYYFSVTGGILGLRVYITLGLYRGDE